MNKYPFLPFSKPDIGEEEIEEVISTLRSGWITTGNKTLEFEKEFRSYIGSNIDAIAVNSATAGLHLALEAVGIREGDEVITTPFTFTATAEVIRYLGADPVFVDINPETLNIDPESIEAKITSKTKAIIPVHYAGLPCEMDKIISIAKKYNLRVIEDAAHALPTKFQGEMVGALDTDATVFSFYATKTITTGEGGMVVTQNPEIAKRCRVMRLHGISHDAFDRYKSTKPSWKYEVIAPGYKYNLTDIAASIGIHQLKKSDKFQSRRSMLSNYYNEAFGDLPLNLPPKARENDLHAWHLYVIRLKNELRLGRDDFINIMSDKGIGCSVHFIPLHLQPYWRDTYNLTPGQFPNTMQVYEKIVSLPLYTAMSDNDAERVVKAVKETLIA